jgi:hypothetical protein
VLQGNVRLETERLPLTTYLAFARGDDRATLEAIERPAVLFVCTHGV